jgi:hypothetical protein
MASNGCISVNTFQRHMGVVDLPHGWGIAPYLPIDQSGYPAIVHALSCSRRRIPPSVGSRSRKEFRVGVSGHQAVLLSMVVWWWRAWHVWKVHSNPSKLLPLELSCSSPAWFLLWTKHGGWWLGVPSCGTICTNDMRLFFQAGSARDMVLRTGLREFGMNLPIFPGGSQALMQWFRLHQAWWEALGPR